MYSFVDDDEQSELCRVLKITIRGNKFVLIQDTGDGSQQMFNNERNYGGVWRHCNFFYYIKISNVNGISVIKTSILACPNYVQKGRNKDLDSGFYEKTRDVLIPTVIKSVYIKCHLSPEVGNTSGLSGKKCGKSNHNITIKVGFPLSIIVNISVRLIFKVWTIGLNTIVRHFPLDFELWHCCNLPYS